MESALNVSINSVAAASAMKLRWVSNAPLGFPVVPEVLDRGGAEGGVSRHPCSEAAVVRGKLSIVVEQSSRKSCLGRRSWV